MLVSTTFIVECSNHMFRCNQTCNQTCYCVGSFFVTSTSRYQSRSSMYFRGLIPRNWPWQFRLDQKQLADILNCKRYRTIEDLT